MDIPLITLTAVVPIILLIISLPVTPFGMGTSQAAMILFFKDYSSEANILAFGITYSTSILIFRGLLGLLYISKISKKNKLPDKAAELPSSQAVSDPALS